MRLSLVAIAVASATASNALTLPNEETDVKPSPVLAARQAVVTPPPCVAMCPPPSQDETEARFDIFGQAFLVEKNLTHAFEYISSTYIVRQSREHSPFSWLFPAQLSLPMKKRWNEF